MNLLKCFMITQADLYFLLSCPLHLYRTKKNIYLCFFIKYIVKIVSLIKILKMIGHNFIFYYISKSNYLHQFERVLKS